MVIETLNSIHAIEYSNYEVLVIDNNTQDPALWRPVQAHCELLGHKFRFMHIENIKGAKAGALNFAYKYIDPRATIISVLDADYHPSKDFLKSLVGHFQNSKLGFIQTPHDYREWRDNLFLTMCYWEYKLFFHSAMISLNERDAGITVGTMCLVRKETLEAIGGWSEWCVTEDSELAIRVHDAGYSSIYIDKSYGQGLIPDSFEGYKKQRYRWTAGPVQEFRRYYKHFIGLTKYESRFSLTQRIFHLNHGLGNALLALNIPFMLLGIAVVVSMIFQHEIIPVPFELWLTATITLLAAPLLTFLLYRVTIKATLKDIFAQSIALLALSHVIHQAALSTMLTGNAAWNRTNKFKTIQSYRSALLSTKEELSIGFLLLLFTVLAFVVFPYQGLSLMLLIGLGYVALGYFAAPLMAVIGVWSFKREHEDQQALHHGAAE
jgi:cellulose synthase/poly-beta-1,6-N-acetylglucosamine synthase-like glycosyltransferase